MSQPDIEAVFVDALQNIAEGVTDLVGFEVAAISIAGDDQTSAEEWGDLRFVPHERMSIEVDRLGWVPDLEPTTLVPSERFVVLFLIAGVVAVLVVGMVDQVISINRAHQRN